MDKRRYHLCIKDTYDGKGILLFKQDKVYESFNNIIYEDYNDRNICRVLPGEEWSYPYLIEAKENGLNLRIEDYYVFTNVKKLRENFNLITYTVKDYTAILRQKQIDSVFN
jgi:hypothetical protein